MVIMERSSKAWRTFIRHENINFFSYKNGVLGLGFNYMRPPTLRKTQLPLEGENGEKEGN